MSSIKLTLYFKLYFQLPCKSRSSIKDLVSFYLPKYLTECCYFMKLVFQKQTGKECCICYKYALQLQCALRGMLAVYVRQGYKWPSVSPLPPLPLAFIFYCYYTESMKRNAPSLDCHYTCCKIQENCLLRVGLEPATFCLLYQLSYLCCHYGVL